MYERWKLNQNFKLITKKIQLNFKIEKCIKLRKKHACTYIYIYEYTIGKSDILYIFIYCLILICISYIYGMVKVFL